MNASTRQRIREAVDARKRAQIKQARGQTFACSECGADREACTTGCKRCHDRHRKIERRQTEPGYKIRESGWQKARRAKALSEAGRIDRDDVNDAA